MLRKKEFDLTAQQQEELLKELDSKDKLPEALWEYLVDNDEEKEEEENRPDYFTVPWKNATYIVNGNKVSVLRKETVEEAIKEAERKVEEAESHLLKMKNNLKNLRS